MEPKFSGNSVKGGKYEKEVRNSLFIKAVPEYNVQD